MTEVEILKDLKHPHIIEYVGYFIDENFAPGSHARQRRHPRVIDSY